ncbi:MAG TPA: glyoxalase, partial [Bifidobacterium sp.]|nr:glyoxalase [Bifidobacterium sp.]
MINHVTVKVKDFEKEEAFYEAALAPLGYGKDPAFPGVQAFVA